MNPCPCGYFNDKSRECMCTPPMIQRYVSKVSGPLLDRIDIHIEVPAVQYKELRGGARRRGRQRFGRGCWRRGSGSMRGLAQAGERTQGDRRRGLSRQIFANSQMETQQIRAVLRALLGCGAVAGAGDATAGVKRAGARPDLEGGADDRGSGGRADIAVKQIAEAIQYRTLDRSYWS